MNAAHNSFPELSDSDKMAFLEIVKKLGVLDPNIDDVADPQITRIHSFIRDLSDVCKAHSSVRKSDELKQKTLDEWIVKNKSPPSSSSSKTTVSPANLPNSLNADTSCGDCGPRKESTNCNIPVNQLSSKLENTGLSGKQNLRTEALGLTCKNMKLQLERIDLQRSELTTALCTKLEESMKMDVLLTESGFSDNQIRKDIATSVCNTGIKEDLMPGQIQSPNTTAIYAPKCSYNLRNLQTKKICCLRKVRRLSDSAKSPTLTSDEVVSCSTVGNISPKSMLKCAASDVIPKVPLEPKLDRNSISYSTKGKKLISVATSEKYGLMDASVEQNNGLKVVKNYQNSIAYSTVTDLEISQHIVESNAMHKPELASLAGERRLVQNETFVSVPDNEHNTILSVSEENNISNTKSNNSETKNNDIDVFEKLSSIPHSVKTASPKEENFPNRLVCELVNHDSIDKNPRYTLETLDISSEIIPTRKRNAKTTRVIKNVNQTLPPHNAKISSLVSYLEWNSDAGNKEVSKESQLSQTEFLVDERISKKLFSKEETENSAFSSQDIENNDTIIENYVAVADKNCTLNEILQCTQSNNDSQGHFQSIMTYNEEPVSSTLKNNSEKNKRIIAQDFETIIKDPVVICKDEGIILKQDIPFCNELTHFVQSNNRQNKTCQKTLPSVLPNESFSNIVKMSPNKDIPIPPASSTSKCKKVRSSPRIRKQRINLQQLITEYNITNIPENIKIKSSIQIGQNQNAACLVSSENKMSIMPCNSLPLENQNVVESSFVNGLKSSNSNHILELFPVKEKLKNKKIKTVTSNENNYQVILENSQDTNADQRKSGPEESSPHILDTSAINETDYLDKVLENGNFLCEINGLDNIYMELQNKNIDLIKGELVINNEICSSMCVESDILNSMLSENSGEGTNLHATDLDTAEMERNHEAYCELREMCKSIEVNLDDLFKKPEIVNSIKSGNPAEIFVIRRQKLANGNTVPIIQKLEKKLLNGIKPGVCDLTKLNFVSS